MTTVKNALTILKSKWFISKIEVNILALAVARFTHQQHNKVFSACVYKCMFCFLRLSPFVCFVFCCLFVCLYGCFCFGSLLQLLQVIAVALNCVSQRFYIPNTLFQHKNTEGPSAQPNGPKNALGILSRSLQSFVTIHSLPIHALST